MKYCRFMFDGKGEYGLLESTAGKDAITGVLLAPPEATGLGNHLKIKRISPIPFVGATILPPVNPSKIVCVGRNYRGHAAEMGKEIPKEPLIFFKPPSSLVGPGENIRRPKLSQHTDYEGELGVVIGRRCYRLNQNEDVRPYILGYTVVNDFTARDLQRRDGQWWRGKGFDTFCPTGPLVTDEIDPWKGVRVSTKVNGAIRQDGNTLDFIFSLDTIIRYVAEVMTLLPGDLIATGTPEGVAPVVAGDVIEVEVEGVGSLRNPVVDDAN
jgi:2-keto-4-pentenoate hydratase/2-oxohepta-3-ene-1,7-dioic acid hydratase in catechol pathway